MRTTVTLNARDTSGHAHKTNASWCCPPALAPINATTQHPSRTTHTMQHRPRQATHTRLGQYGVWRGVLAALIAAANHVPRPRSTGVATLTNCIFRRAHHTGRGLGGRAARLKPPAVARGRVHRCTTKQRWLPPRTAGDYAAANAVVSYSPSEQIATEIHAPDLAAAAGGCGC